MSTPDNPAAPETTDDPLRARCRGVLPLAARLEPWMRELAGDPARCAALLEEFGSPVNALHPGRFAANGRELVDAAAARGLRLRPFYARKANKGLTFVDAAREAGFGVDVASHAELTQVLDSGVAGADVVVSAAIKSPALLETAIRAGAVISLDNRTELAEVAAAARRLGARPRVCPRLAPDPAALPPTRFGERLAVWQGLAGELVGTADVAGVHLHLHGYAAADRVTALAEVLALVDALRAAGASITFVDLGGGVPMSYLVSCAEWEEFWPAHRALLGAGTPATWKGRPLNSVYPAWQTPVRGTWVGELLDAPLEPGRDVAAALRSRNLELRLEPGRSLLDGCGMTLARVAFVKERSDGVPLVGLAMNRTQLRSAADEFMVDPLLVPAPDTPDSSGDARDLPRLAGPVQAYFVGAYCIEDELIFSRRFLLPEGVGPGDVLAVPNTAGYVMHIVESASHQLPLARNVVVGAPGAAGLAADTRPDAIDAPSALTGPATI